MNLLFLFIIAFHATCSWALPQLPPRPAFPHIPDITRTLNPPQTRVDIEHSESLVAYRLYDLGNRLEWRDRQIERILNTLRRLDEVRRYATDASRERYDRNRRAIPEIPTKNDLVSVETQGKPQTDVVVPKEVDEMEWEGNFTRPEDPRPKPDSAPF